MTRKKTGEGGGKGNRRARSPQQIADESRARGVPEEELQGPPARETVYLHTDREREAAERAREHTSSSPEMTGGDVDADWEQADSIGEEAVGGTVSTPDQDVVDELGDALGVPRAPDDEVRSSAEILDARDRDRREQEP